MVPLEQELWRMMKKNQTNKDQNIWINKSKHSLRISSLFIYLKNNKTEVFYQAYFKQAKQDYITSYLHRSIVFVLTQKKDIHLQSNFDYLKYNHESTYLSSMVFFLLKT